MNLSLLNNHIVINESENILVDTGSPYSFHPSGFLTLDNDKVEVRSSLPGLSREYLSEKVGADIHGLIGMDIINKLPTFFHLRHGFIYFNDDGEYYGHPSFNMYKLPSVARGLFAIIISVNHHFAKMIVDSGAPISYIHPRFLEGLTPDATLVDFSPYIGEFQTQTYICDVDILVNTSHETRYKQAFGIPPAAISMILKQFNVDGIIGVELFKRYTMRVKNGVLNFPPQGI